MSQDHIHTFAQFIGTAEDGELHQDLSDQLVEIVAALENHVRDRGGKPSATLALTIGFKLDNGLLEVRAEYKIKLPKSERAKSVFWTTPENHLSRRNPRQQELPLRSIDDRREVRSV
ncbi:hypothetical protein EDC65_2280 [Stella humosa]|uniref:Uncharacterized protein n=1 Tax=Stella humosa TaxID=94 RepID=A0A3N1M9Y4_9PROT|nr:hypothetical protein [Stella humosa]ROQ00481.1 hypothetical protein EDC65_2280 [Stella humosa]BBK30274.1 hypothetical protein STHU_09080 [Stella humosa]